jgi:hypothetical protein
MNNVKKKEKVAWSFPFIPLDRAMASMDGLIRIIPGGKSKVLTGYSL